MLLFTTSTKEYYLKVNVWGQSTTVFTFIGLVVLTITINVIKCKSDIGIFLFLFWWWNTMRMKLHCSSFVIVSSVSDKYLLFPRLQHGCENTTSCTAGLVQCCSSPKITQATLRTLDAIGFMIWRSAMSILMRTRCHLNDYHSAWKHQLKACKALKSWLLSTALYDHPRCRQMVYCSSLLSGSGEAPKAFRVCPSSGTNCDTSGLSFQKTNCDKTIPSTVPFHKIKLNKMCPSRPFLHIKCDKVPSGMLSSKKKKIL